MENAILYAKVIEKSLESGWIPPSPFGDDFSWTVVDDSFCMKNPIWDFHLSMVREQTISVSIERVLFDHSFAKALCGDKIVKHELTGIEMPKWMEYLINLALSSNRTLFLSNFINGNN